MQDVSQTKICAESVEKCKWKPWALSDTDVTLKKLMTLMHSHCIDIIPIAAHIDSHVHGMTDAEVLETADMILKCGTPVLQDSMLPNYLEKITMCSFATGKTPFRNVDPLVHVFSKAWPMRCSIRNFQEIVSNYVVNKKQIYECMMSVLYCFLSGNYAHARQAAPFNVQRMLYKHFVWNPITAAHLAQWIRQGHQQIMFAAIKEYIVYCVSQVPALQDTLEDVYPWQQFRTNVIEQSNSMRNIVFCKINTADPFSTVVSFTGTSKGLKCTQSAPSWKSILSEFLAIMRNVSVSPEPFTGYPLRYEIYQKIRVLPRHALLESAVAFGVDENIVSQLKIAYSTGGWKCRQKMNTRCIFTGLSTRNQYQAHEFSHAWFAHLSAELFPLPMHIVYLQKRAIAANSVSSMMYMCICCKQLRGFVVDAQSAAKTAWARGNHKVLYDDYTGELYCGRKVEKNTQKESNESSYWKYEQAQMCTQGKLISHDLLGNILALNGTMYSICPLCACKMEITNDRYIGDIFCCVHCQYKKSKEYRPICDHCMMPCSCFTPYRCSDGDVKICSKCSRCWMTGDLMEKMSKTDVHVAINERWPKNKVIVTFA